MSKSIEKRDSFYMSVAWARLRYKVLTRYGSRCRCCGATAADGSRIHVDHIKPRSKFPELELVESNLQVLCGRCNVGKGSFDQTDWRPPYVVDATARRIMICFAEPMRVTEIQCKKIMEFMESVAVLNPPEGKEYWSCKPKLVAPVELVYEFTDFSKDTLLFHVLEQECAA